MAGLFPASWCDPYGRTPHGDGMEVSIDMTMVTTDNGIRITAVKTPPRARQTSMADAVANAMALCMEEGCLQEKPCDAPLKPSECDKMESDDHEASSDRDRNPGPGGRQKREEGTTPREPRNSTGGGSDEKPSPGGSDDDDDEKRKLSKKSSNPFK